MIDSPCTVRSTRVVVLLVSLYAVDIFIRSCSSSLITVSHPQSVTHFTNVSSRQLISRLCLPQGWFLLECSAPRRCDIIVMSRCLGNSENMDRHQHEPCNIYTVYKKVLITRNMFEKPLTRSSFLEVS